MTDFIQRAADIHAGNVAAGWWTDLTTGDSILLTRDRGSLMMLVVTELAEADSDGPDDKLPEYEMFAVELADTAIRLFDMIGAEATVDGDTPVRALPGAAIIRQIIEQRRTVQLMAVVKVVCEAMEHYRKGRRADYRASLWAAMEATYLVANENGIHLDSIIDAKREFNAQRADHKPENRRAVGGKAL